MIYAGTIIEINNNKTYVFTMDYSVVAIRTRKDYFLGQQITFSKKDKYIDFYLLRSNTLKTLIFTAAAILLISALALSVFQPFSGKAGFDELCTALVSVDINPSIEISINRDEKIVGASAFNEDGEKLLKTLKLKEKSLSDGVSEIVLAAKSMGYMEDKKVVLVSAALYGDVAKANSEAYSGQLKKILGTLEANSEATVLTVFVDDPKIVDQAKNNKLSIGKELLYEYAQTQNDTLTADEVRNTSINDLLDKLNALEQDGKLVDTIKNPPASQSSTDTPQVTDTPTVTASPSEEEAAASLTPEAENTPTPTKEPEAAEETSSEEEPVATDAPTATPKPVKDPEPDTAEFDPKLTASADGETIEFSWTELGSDRVTHDGKIYHGFLYYKVVASADNKHPIYPDDGYLAVISDRHDNEWSVNPAEGDYNYSPELISGETYYFSITYVFESGRITSDTQTIKIPEYAQDIPEQSPDTLKLTISSDGTSLTFNWTPLNSSSINFNGRTYSDFAYYKIVASKDNPNPKYPEDGYLTYISDCYADTWTVNPYEGDYNYSPELIPGETYYFSITYVFGNGKLYSNTVQYTVP